VSRTEDRKRSNAAAAAPSNMSGELANSVASPSAAQARVLTGLPFILVS